MTKRLFALFLALFVSLFFAACSHEVKEKDAKNLRVIGATVLLELLYPQGIAALWYKPYPEDLEFMPKGAENLPVLGMQWEVNFENVVALKPDLLVFSKRTDDTIIEPYKKLGIKTLKLDSGFDDLNETLPVLGRELGVEKKAQKLLKFQQKQQENLANLRQKVAKKPRIYFAFGIEGLQTECAGQKNIEDLAAIIGGENVVQCANFGTNQRFVQMNYEQIIALNPEAIFVREIALYKEMTQNPNKFWQKTRAVQDKKIFYAPSSPSNWLHRPPSVMRILGYPWAFSKLHPELLSENEMRQIAKDFFAEFLRPISDEDYARLEGKK